MIAFTAVMTVFAQAAPAAEGPQLSPAPYKALPVGTKVNYDNWAFVIKRSDGFESAVKVPRIGKWFITYAVFGRAGENVYSPAGGPAWDTELGGGARSALEGLWPLQVGKKASIGFQEKHGGGDRTWKLTLEVTGTESLVLNNLAYPAYMVREHASSEGDGNRPALEYTASHWYNPDSGLILKSRRQWIRSPDAGAEEQYNIVRVSYPDGTTTHALKGTKSVGGVDQTLIAEVQRLKQEVAQVRSAGGGGASAPVVAEVDTEKIDFGRYYALVIGIDKYKHLPKLKTAVKDAEGVAKVLKEDYGFDVGLLINPTRDQIIDALDEYREKLGAGDNILIYYAGHGWLDEDADRGYWLPTDASATRRSRWVSNATITDTLRTLQAKHVMVVADSCYSGTLTRSANISLRTGEYLKRMSKKYARVALVSGGLEPVADSDGSGNSPFARVFINALKNNTSVLDGTQLFSKIRRPVILAAQQTPEYSDVRNAGHDGGDFLFVRKKK
ncbi:MAG: caspase family protein [Rhodospirillales bacterium]|nr:caspase family protein [Rhodospirillales bacterium]